MTYKVRTLISYYWCLGFALRIQIVLQVLSGFTIGLRFISSSSQSFFSILSVVLFCYYGRIIHYSHSSGVSYYFALVKIHIIKGLYAGSNNSRNVW